MKTWIDHVAPDQPGYCSLFFGLVRTISWFSFHRLLQQAADHDGCVGFVYFDGTYQERGAIWGLHDDFQGRYTANCRA